MVDSRSQWREQIACELLRAPHDRHHPWRTPVLATCSPEGAPRSRTVVLRAVDEDGAVLRVYTDARSGKVGELLREPRVSLLFWSPRLSLQLRVEGFARVHTDGDRVLDAWSRMRQAPSAGDYLSPQAPGEALDGCDPLQAVPPLEGPMTHPLDAPHHLAVIECRALSWDALLLARQGHRRAAWTFDAAGQPDAGQWLVP